MPKSGSPAPPALKNVAEARANELTEEEKLQAIVHTFGGGLAPARAEAVVKFMSKWGADAKSLRFDSVAKKMGTTWPQVEATIRSVPELQAIWEKKLESVGGLLLSEAVEIADDDSNDMTADGKGNAAAVNRAKVRIDTRFRLAARLAPERFSEKGGGGNGKVEVNVHIGKEVDSARQRVIEIKKTAAGKAKRSDEGAGL